MKKKKNGEQLMYSSYKSMFLFLHMIPFQKLIVFSSGSKF